MKISQQLKEKDIAEYLVYMWQVEGLTHTNKYGIDFIRNNIIPRYPVEEHVALERWYRNSADMMRAEGVVEKGYLQINRSVIHNLTDSHTELLASMKYPFHNATYLKALPFIVELWQKNGPKEESELETCFEMLYGILLLRLQKKRISQGIAKAVESISSFFLLFANYYGKDKEGELRLGDDWRDVWVINSKLKYVNIPVCWGWKMYHDRRE